MILEFQNGRQIEVVRIFGGPRMILGEQRDTLSIEIDPSTSNLEDLKVLFQDTGKTNKLFTYIGDGDEEYPNQIKTEIGEGYNILVSARRESRKVTRQPGKIYPVEYKDIFVVNLAQLTYQEYQEFLVGTWTPPNLNG